MRIIITGASRGIGRGLAQNLARQGHELLLTARDPGRLEKACKEIWEATGSSTVIALPADMSRMREVKRFANSIGNALPSADLLVNNHGGVFPERQVTDEGLEMNFALNYLSVFLLTRELTPQLSPFARIVNVAAEAHRSAILDLDDLQSANGYQSVSAYCSARLMTILFTRALASRLEESGTDVVAVHPGSMFTDALKAMRTEFTRHTGTTEFPQALPVEYGLQPLLNVILHKRNDNGSYYVLDQKADPSAQAMRQDLAEQLWMRSALILKRLTAAY